MMMMKMKIDICMQTGNKMTQKKEKEIEVGNTMMMMMTRKQRAIKLQRMNLFCLFFCFLLFFLLFIR